MNKDNCLLPNYICCKCIKSSRNEHCDVRFLGYYFVRSFFSQDYLIINEIAVNGYKLQKCCTILPKNEEEFKTSQLNNEKKFSGKNIIKKKHYDYISQNFTPSTNCPFYMEYMLVSWNGKNNKTIAD